MKSLITQTIWNDGSTEDFIEVNFKVSNDRLSADFSAYTSIYEIKKIWGNDLTGRILKGEKLIWEPQGSLVKSVKISCELFNKRGIIELVFSVIFDPAKLDNIQEDVTLRLLLEPSELDIYCNRITKFEGIVGEVADIIES